MALAGVRPKQVEEAEPPSGLGALLRQARERRAVSLDQISKETKIPRRHLEALEHDDLSVAPGGIYLRAEVRAYARAVRLDESLALARLERLLSPLAAPGGTSAAARSSEADRRVAVLTPVRPWVAVAVLTLAAVLATLSWRSTGRRDDVGSRDAAASSGGLDRASRSLTREAAPVVAPDATPSARDATLVPRAATLDSANAEASTLAAAPPASLVTAPESPEKLPRPTVTQPAMRPVEPSRAVDDSQTTKDGLTELVIATQPPGARVTVDGISWGTSPVTIHHLSPGAKRIRVTLDGFVSAERSITLAAGRRQRIEVPLRENVSGRPDGRVP